MFTSAPTSPVAELGVQDDDKSKRRPEIKDSWAIRPCSVYKDEYDDCTSFKARFHQYFVHGESSDCSQWLNDYKSCKKYESSDGFDVSAGEEVVASEARRRENRFQGHYGNTVWKKRRAPPADWSKPLPDWMQKRDENSFLNFKQMERDGKVVPNNLFDTAPPTFFCSIM